MGGLIGFNLVMEIYPKKWTKSDLNDTSIESGCYFVNVASNVTNSPEGFTRYLLIQFNLMGRDGVDSIAQLAFCWVGGPSYSELKSRSYYNGTWGSWK